MKASARTRGRAFVQLVVPAVLVALVAAAAAAGCGGDSDPDSTVDPGPEPTETSGTTEAPSSITTAPVPQDVVVEGPSCPQDFQEDTDTIIERRTEVGVGGSLEVTVVSAPSIPCSWGSPEVGNLALVREVDHRTEWPAEDGEAVPGAPGTETWVFEALHAGETTVSLECVCLDEEGVDEELRGTFVLTVVVRG